MTSSSNATIRKRMRREEAEAIRAGLVAFSESLNEQVTELRNTISTVVAKSDLTDQDTERCASLINSLMSSLELSKSLLARPTPSTLHRTSSSSTSHLPEIAASHRIKSPPSSLNQRSLSVPSDRIEVSSLQREVHPLPNSLTASPSSRFNTASRMHDEKYPYLQSQIASPEGRNRLLYPNRLPANRRPQRTPSTLASLEEASMPAAPQNFLNTSVLSPSRKKTLLTTPSTAVAADSSTAPVERTFHFNLNFPAGGFAESFGDDTPKSTNKLK